MEKNQIILGDCLEVMKTMADKSVDLVLTDPPYGTTGLEWDIVANFNLMWAQLKRITKDKGAIVMTCSQPFTTQLIASNYDYFRYCWVWNKTIQGNPLIAKYQPLKIHEDIAVFSKETHNYYPRMTSGKMRTKGGGESKIWNVPNPQYESDEYFPKSIIEFSNADRSMEHQTQKPVPLMEYLVATYSKEGDTILDPFLGSGTTAIAAHNLNRNFIGIEISPEYVKIAQDRLSALSEPLF